MTTTKRIRDLEHLGICLNHQAGYRDIALEPTELKAVEPGFALSRYAWPR